MTPERRRQVWQLYHAALERDVEERAAFLDAACAGDAALRHEVEWLLTQEQTPEKSLAGPGSIAAILEREPNWQTLPEKTPVAVRRLLRRCLEKDRKGRLADAADARLEIDEALVTEPAASAAATAMARPEARARGRRATVLAGVTLGAAAVAAVTVWVLMRPAPPRVTRTTITPSGVAAVSVDGIGRDVAITADGTRVVYVGNNGAQLFVRAMDRLEATALSGLGTPRHPFLSPDGQWIGFFDGNTTLKKVAMTGGPAVMLCPVPSAHRGATWGADGTIIFAEQGTSSGLWRVSAAGGEPALLTKPNRERGETDHLWPEFLPGTQAVLFTITPTTGSVAPRARHPRSGKRHLDGISAGRR